MQTASGKKQVCQRLHLCHFLLGGQGLAILAQLRPQLVAWQMQAGASHLYVNVINAEGLYAGVVMLKQGN